MKQWTGWALAALALLIASPAVAQGYTAPHWVSDPIAWRAHKATAATGEFLKDDNDDLIGKAGLEVRIGFDGKKPVAVDDSKLSGGQSVVASLILLMALTMQEGESAAGFFILDEPFAHLSVERIDEVARFLTVTRAQFLITTPTTHNLLVYNPAGLTLNLRKKGATERHAPVPTFLRR